MRTLTTFQLTDFFDTFICLLAAFIFGAIIGAERQYRQRTAGLRTNVLVSLGAAAFVDLSIGLNGPDGAVRVISYVVSGIGFLGAGVILREGLNIRGLNTAATLWCSAAVGACAGADRIAQALLLTIFVVIGNTSLRRLVDRINRIPFDEMTSEATYELRITSDLASVESDREFVITQLEQAHYPAREIKTEELNDGRVRLIAILANLSINPDELDVVVERIKSRPGVRNAAWEMRA